MRLFTADGVPPELMPEMVRLLQSSSVEPSHGIALGFDQRRSEFMAELDQALHRLSGMGFRTKILYLEADPAVIMRRYATTRRPHPLEREDRFGTSRTRRNGTPCPPSGKSPIRSSTHLPFPSMTCGGSFSANGTAPWSGFIPSRSISFPSDSNTASPRSGSRL